LKDVFGLDFKPLGKTFNNLGYRTTRPIITIDEIGIEQFEAIYNRAKNFPNVLVSLTDEVETEFAPKNETEAQLFDDISSILNVPQLDETVKKRLQASRIGQNRFRHYLMEYWGSRCSVTGFEDERVLRASHVKPWRDCDNFERLDPFNGLLLIPNLDAVFDQGLITFDEQGCIEVSPSFQEKAKFLGITSEMRLRHIDERHKKYIAYHRKKVFIAE
jgi:putative restriction endonuclease